MPKRTNLRVCVDVHDAVVVSAKHLRMQPKDLAHALLAQELKLGERGLAPLRCSRVLKKTVVVRAPGRGSPRFTLSLGEPQSKKLHKLADKARTSVCAQFSKLLVRGLIAGGFIAEVVT